MPRRLRREFETLSCMVTIYCRDHHGEGEHPCATCRGFLHYARERLHKCPYGADKPTCSRCPIHCYKARQRGRARAIMGYAGPRMPWRHPWLAWCHLLDGRRRVPHPMSLRRQRGRP